MQQNKYFDLLCNFVMYKHYVVQGFLCIGPNWNLKGLLVFLQCHPNWANLILQGDVTQMYQIYITWWLITTRELGLMFPWWRFHGAMYRFALVMSLVNSNDHIESLKFCMMYKGVAFVLHFFLNDWFSWKNHEHFRDLNMLCSCLCMSFMDGSRYHFVTNGCKAKF